LNEQYLILFEASKPMPNKNLFEDETNDIPLANSKSTPLTLSLRLCHRNRYINSHQIKEIAIDTYKTKGGRGITFTDLLERGFGLHKRQAQDMLKYHSRKGTLFTLQDRRPQQYYPTEIKSEIMERKLQENTPICPSAVGLSNLPLSKGPLANCLQPLIVETLEGYVLPLLATAPLFIHNMHFTIKISSEYYTELNLPSYKQNNGKHHEEVIGKSLVTYTFYKKGTVNIQVLCSNNPYKLETEEDRSRILAFFGQLRSGLIGLLCDKHERIVPDILYWEITECDINKDIRVSDLLHYTAIKIQVRHLDHLFRVYIKAMGKDTICRIEENKRPNITAIEFINDVFNPLEKLEVYLKGYDEKIDEIQHKVRELSRKFDSLQISLSADILFQNIRSRSGSL